MSDLIKERPIIFNADMVRAVLDGRKTQTRRLVESHGRWACDIIQDWDEKDKSYGPYYQDEYGDSQLSITLCPYGKVGDELWVRETIKATYFGDSWQINYVADGLGVNLFKENIDVDTPLKYSKSRPTIPSIHMPRWASRIQLRIKDIRVERVQDITTDNVWAEGINKEEYEEWREDVANIGVPLGTTYEQPIDLFRNLWDSISAKRGYGWEINCWVWVIVFEVINKKGS